MKEITKYQANDRRRDKDEITHLRKAIMSHQEYTEEIGSRPKYWLIDVELYNALEETEIIPRRARADLKNLVCGKDSSDLYGYRDLRDLGVAPDFRDGYGWNVYSNNAIVAHFMTKKFASEYVDMKNAELQKQVKYKMRFTYNHGNSILSSGCKA